MNNLLIFCFLVFSQYLHSQNTAKTDSLKSRLNNKRVPLHDSTKINTLLALSEIYSSQYPDTSIFYAKQAKILAEKIILREREGTLLWHTVKKSIGSALISLGRGDFNLGNYEEALNYFSDANKIFSIIKDNKGMASSLGNIGITHFSLGNHTQALQNLLHALKIDSINISHALQSGNKLQEEQSKKSLGIRLSSVGIVYQNLGNYPKALQFYFKALETDRTIGNKKGVAAKLGNIGILYREQGNYEMALKYFLQGLKIDSLLGNRKGIANKLGNIGVVYMEKGNYPEALEYFFAALKTDSIMGNKREVASHFLHIGIVYSEQADKISKDSSASRKQLFTRAFSFFFKALEVDSMIHNKIGVAIDLHNLGALKKKLQLYDEAEKYLLRSLAISDSIGVLKNLIGTEETISALYALTNRWEKAYLHHVLYRKVKDTVFGEEKIKDIGRIEMTHELEMAELEHKRIENEKLKAEREKTSKRNLLQYSLIFFLMTALLVSLLYSNRLMKVLPEKMFFNRVSKVNVGFFMIFIFIFLLFETLLLLADPYINSLTGGAPAWVLLVNAFMACLMFPAHAFIERTLAKKTGIAKQTQYALHIVTVLMIFTLFNSFVLYEKSETSHPLNPIAKKQVNKNINVTLQNLKFEKSITDLYAETKRWQMAYEHHILYSRLKDTVFGEEKTKTIGRLEVKHEIEMKEYFRKHEERERRKQEIVSLERRNRLQYFAIFIGLVALIGSIMMLSRLRLPVWFIEFLSFVPFLILFELILVFCDPYLDVFTAGAPFYRLLFNGVIAGLLYPLQGYSENRMKRLFYRVGEN